MPEKQWNDDLANIAKLGFVYVQMGQGAWPRFEPKDGTTDFSWMDRCIDLATRHKLKVILCPGTDVPPAWLFAGNPEVEAVSPESRRYVGSQRYAGLTQPLYRDRVERITHTLAKRFGDNTSVIGWIVQENSVPDYADTARIAFQAFMKDKAKGSLDTLHKRWANPDGAQVYGDWRQIAIPNPTAGFQNVYEQRDYQRFLDNLSTELLQSQVDILKKFTLNQFVSACNSTATYSTSQKEEWERRVAGINPFLISGQDFPSSAVWPGDDDRQPLLEHDLMQSVAGHGGQAGLPLLREDYYFRPGRIRLKIWQQFGLGVDFLTLTQYTGGMVHPGTQTLTPQGQEIIETLDAIEKLKGYRMLEAVQPFALSKLKTAILYDHDAMALTEMATSETRDNANLREAYNAIRATGAPITFVPPGLELSIKDFSVLVIPNHTTATPEEIARWKRYVRQGGQLLLYGNVGRRLEKGPLPDAPYGSTLGSLTGVRATGLSSSGPMVRVRDAKFLAQGPCYLLEPLPGMQDSVEAYGTYSGTAQSLPDIWLDKMAIAERRIGKGRVVYAGAHCVSQSNNPTEWVSDILANYYKMAGAEPLSLPANVYADWHEGLMVITNCSQITFNPPYPEKDRIIGTGLTILPGDVGVYKFYK